MIRYVARAVAIVLLVGWSLLNGGCGSKSDTGKSGGMATQGDTDEARASYDDPNLAKLTRDLRRWIVATRERPASFEDFASKAKINAPTPPAGKKYSITSEMRVIYVNQ